MQKPGLILVMILLLSQLSLQAQTKKQFSISGTIKDQTTGETLPGATVSFLGISGIGVSTNTYGFYSIRMPEGTYALVTSYTGYVTDTVHIDLNKNTVLNLNIASSHSQLKEVVVTSSSGKSNNILTTPAGVQRLSVEAIKNIPVLLGEKDVLKTIQLLPGIVSAGDGKSGFFVRGGGADQNLILLDEATVYNPSHVLGFFSVFNSDAIKDITIYKGGMPSNYGGRLSSVEDVQMRDGNSQHFGVSGGLGLIASRLAAEGPLFNHKGSFFISARRSYIDLFTPLAKDTTVKGTKLYFYDINLKANYNVNENNHIFLSGYFGQDNFSMKNGNGLDYGNSTGTFRWNHLFNSRLFANTSLIYSNYVYNVHIVSDRNNVKVTSGITDYHFKEDFNYFLNSKNKIDFGLDLTYHNTQPGSAQASQSSNFNNVTLQKKYSLESAVYASHDWKATDNLKIVYGFRLSGLSVLGPGSFNSYDASGNIIGTKTYSNNQVAKTYINLEPRLALSYQLTDISSVKVFYDRTVQNIHLLNNTTAASPTTIYLPSTLNVKPEVADQIALGYYRDFHEHTFEFSAEVYYKNLQNQIDYKNNANLVGNANIEADLLYGKGRAYGIETFLKKKTGLFTGWISYTLSKSERQIPGINGGSYYPASQDQRNHLSIVAMYQVSKRWNFSGDFIYNTGNPVTYPSGKFSVNGAPIYSYSARNANHLPAYNRLDIGVTFQVKKTATYESSWNFSVYNIYGQANPYTIAFQNDPKNLNKTQVLQTTLFKMVPSVTYNFKFL